MQHLTCINWGLEPSRLRMAWPISSKSPPLAARILGSASPYWSYHSAHLVPCQSAAHLVKAESGRPALGQCAGQRTSIHASSPHFRPLGNKNMWNLSESLDKTLQKLHMLGTINMRVKSSHGRPQCGDACAYTHATARLSCFLLLTNFETGFL